MRHVKLVDEFYYLFRNLFANRVYKDMFTNGVSIVYLGNKRESLSARLAAFDEYDVSSDLYQYSCVEPDFTLFEKNNYIANIKGARLAGQPDLVIEVWSDSNTSADRAFKKYLYSTSPVTEHWYLEQDSNEVECWLGDKKLRVQTLLNPLNTQSGLQIDLAHFAI